MTNTSPVGGGSNCPSSGIRYIPKRSAPPSNPRPSTTQQPGQPEPTNPVEPRRGNLRVYTNDDQQQRGCLISHGTWFTSGTCATFKAQDVAGMLLSLFPLAMHKTNLSQVAFMSKHAEDLVAS